MYDAHCSHTRQDGKDGKNGKGGNAGNDVNHGPGGPDDEKTSVKPDTEARLLARGMDHSLARSKITSLMVRHTSRPAIQRCCERGPSTDDQSKNTKTCEVEPGLSHSTRM